MTETDGNIGIVSKTPIPRAVVSVSVSIGAFLGSRYQYRYRSSHLHQFLGHMQQFLIKLSLGINISPGTFFWYQCQYRSRLRLIESIGISLGIDLEPAKVSISVSYQNFWSRLSLQSRSIVHTYIYTLPFTTFNV